MILEVGRYINHSNNYSIGLPFESNDTTQDGTKKSLNYNTDPIPNGDTFQVTTEPLFGRYIPFTTNAGKNYIFNGFMDSTNTQINQDNGLQLVYVLSADPNNYIFPMCINTFSVLDQKKYALINTNFKGAWRPDMNPVTSYNADLLLGKFRIKAPIGFESPNNLAALVTKQLTQTNPQSVPFTFLPKAKEESGFSDDAYALQSHLQGQAMATIGANGEIKFTGNDKDPIYQSLGTDEPIRYSTACNLLLQADLVDLGQDNMAYRSPAKDVTGNFDCANTTGLIAVTVTAGFFNNWRAGDKIIVVSGSTILDPNTIVSAINPPPDNVTLSFTLNLVPPPTQTSTDNTVFKIVGGGRYITPMPIYLFGNYDSATNTYDYYSPHNDNPSYDLTNVEFGGNPEYIYGNITLDRQNYEDFGNNEYNYTLTQSANPLPNSPLQFLENVYIKWVGTDNSDQNYVIVGSSEADYEVFELSFTYISQNAGNLDFIYDEYRYDGTVTNNLGNNRLLQNYSDGNGATPFSLYNYEVDTAENPNLKYFVRKVFLREKKIAVFDFLGNFLTFGNNNTLNNNLIVFNPPINDTFTLPYTLHFNKGGTNPNANEYLQSVNNSNVFAGNTRVAVTFWLKLQTGATQGSVQRLLRINGNNMIVYADENNKRLRVDSKIAPVGFQTAETNINEIELDTWHFIYIKVDKANPNNNLKCEIFVDGVSLPLQIVWTDATPFQNLTKQINVGGYVTGPQNTARDMVGNITNLAIYDLAPTDDYPSLTNSYNNGYIWDARKVQPDVGQNYVAPTLYYFLGKGDEPVGNSLTITEQMGNGPNLISYNFTGDEIETDNIPPVFELSESSWQSALPFQVFRDETFEWVAVAGGIGVIDGNYMDMPVHNIIPTNIEYNEKNLKLLQKFLLGTEQYEGNKTSQQGIENDNDGYCCLLDAGRSSDKGDVYDGKDYNSEDPIKNYTDIEKTLLFSWQPGQDIQNDIIVAPRLVTPLSQDNHEQRFKVFSRYKENAKQRLVYAPTAPNYIEVDLNNNSLNSGQLFYFDNPSNSDVYDDSLSKDLGIAVYPIYYIKKNDNLNPTQNFEVKRICAFDFFETEKRFPQTDLYKIMWGTPAIFSPQFADHSQIMAINLENIQGAPYTPADPSADPPVEENISFSFDVSDYSSFINVGAGSAGCNYNETLNRFDFNYFHTPRKLNFDDTKDANVGNEVAVFNDIPTLKPLFTDTPQFFNDRNPYINDSLAGIFIKDIYFQSPTNDDITDISDTKSIIMTKTDYFGSLPWKMGFDIRDLKPIRFTTKPFNNRFNTSFQNKYESLDERKLTLSPLTTNSDVDVGGATSLNIFPINVAGNGQPKFSLGGVNGFKANLDVESNEIVASNLNSSIDNGFYRVYCDLPLSTFRYVGAEQDLPAIGVCLRNYSSGGFYFGYSTSYQIEITKDQPLNTIRTIIRNANGNIARNLNEKCSVFYKVQRQIVTQEAPKPPPDPVVKELKEIDKQLEENDKNEADRDMTLEEQLEQILNIEVPEEMPQGELLKEDLRIKLKKGIINNLLQRIVKSYDDLEIDNAEKRTVAQGVTSYFSRNRGSILSTFDAIDNARSRDEVRKLGKQLRSALKGFRLTAQGLELGKPKFTTNFKFKKGFYSNITNKLFDTLTSPTPNIGALPNEIIKNMGKGFIVGTPASRGAVKRGGFQDKEEAEFQRGMRTDLRQRTRMRQRMGERINRSSVPEESEPVELQQTPDIK